MDSLCDMQLQKVILNAGSFSHRDYVNMKKKSRTRNTIPRVYRAVTASR